uniref:Xylulose kinase-1 n=1 Tax=Tanacetum cinerariifolium TaxID=118510 RepID=A0A6L2N4I2_TANCI|nr:hypothetical protein [Tanacetum cinerariifolium]
MVAILEKSEHNVDFHSIVDFIEASHLRYALTFKPTVYVSHIRQFWSTARIETTKEGTKILATIDGNLRTIFESSIRRNLKLNDEGEGSATLTEPHHIPSPEAQQTSPTTYSSPTLPPVTTAPIPTVTPSDIPYLRQYTRRARIAQSLALLPVADEPASPLRDVSQGEACPTVSSFEAEQDRANIAKTSTLPYESTSRVPFLAADEGTTVLSSGVAEVPTGSGSIPTVGPPAARVPTGSDVVPTVGLIFATATVVTPYIRRKGKEKMIESKTPKKKKTQEQMDIQMARQLDEEMQREAQRMNEQIAKDSKISRIHVEEELQIMIDGLDRRNETVAKYQDNYAKVQKYQSQQRKPLIKKQQREFYTLVLRNQAGWKAKDFKGMTLEDIKENFNVVWKQIHDFIPIGSKEEAGRFKRKGIRFEQESVKKLKTLDWSIKFRGGFLGIKCTRHSHCHLWSSHYQKKFPVPVKKIPTAEEKQCHCCEDCTATKVKK